MFLTTFFVTTVCVVGLFLLIAYLRQGTVATIPMGGRTQSFESELSPDAVFSRLVHGVGRFGLADSDPDSRMLVLETKPTFATWGFFYPVAITAGEAGGSQITIGIRSRVIQWGPLVTRWHNQCRDACERAITAELPKARVVA